MTLKMVALNNKLKMYEKFVFSFFFREGLFKNVQNFVVVSTRVFLF